MSTDLARGESRAATRADRRRRDLPPDGRGRPPVLALFARAIRSSWLPVLVAIAPMLAGIGYLALYRGDFSPFGDGVYLEAHVREIGVHPVLLGPFSRYGWSHPGPAIYAVLAPAYRLFGSSFRGVAIGALLMNSACVVAIAVGVRRRLGHAAMLVTLLVITVYLLVLGPAELRNSWNPYLPILPFALACLLCWWLVEGSRWALPAAVVLASFAVQSHVGFVLPAAGLTVATAGLLLLSRLRFRQPGQSAPTNPGWRGPLLVTAGAVVALWLPPVVEQLTTSPGNLQAIADYFRRSEPDGTWSAGLHALANDVGALPARVAGHASTSTGLGVPSVPGWSVVVAVLLFGLAVAVARRRPEIRTLAVLAATLAVVSVLAVRRIVGLPYDYLVAWTLLTGVLLWLTVGLAGVGMLRDRAAARQPDRVRSPFSTAAGATAACGLAVVALAVVAVPGVRTQVRPDTAWVYNDGITPALRTQVVAALGRDPGTVRVQARPRNAAEFLDVTNRSASLLLALRKRGIDAQAPPESRAAFGARYVEHAGAARTSLAVMTRGGTPPAGSRLVAAAGSVVVYASP